MATGWAYIDCADSGDGGGQAAGPTGSIQFLTGSNATSGSANLIYHTASYLGYAASTMILTGTLVVAGKISASAFIVHQTDTISGSTIFGNDVADYHIRTGSLYVGTTNGTTFTVSPTLSQSQTLGFRGGYTKVSSAQYTASTSDYIIGVVQTGEVNLRMPTASVANSGSIIVIKDEVPSRGGDSIYVSASATAGETIDGHNYYELTGTMPAISLYSNGTDWFVF